MGLILGHQHPENDVDQEAGKRGGGNRRQHIEAANDPYIPAQCVGEPAAYTCNNPLATRSPDRDSHRHVQARQEEGDCERKER